MATTHPPEVATDADLQSYQAIASLISREYSKAMKNVLDALQDPTSFQETVRSLGEEQGIDPAVMADPPALYRAFWKYAKGLQADLHWLNIAGVPERGSQDVRRFAPEEPPLPPTDVAAERLEIGFGGFGFNFGLRV
jgi:hypothetical protein